MYYRHIDGLRALSVLLIIPFHLQIPAFVGGFVSLEVFFVISGFLITNMILRDTMPVDSPCASSAFAGSRGWFPPSS